MSALSVQKIEYKDLGLFGRARKPMQPYEPEAPPNPEESKEGLQGKVPWK